MVQVNHRLQCLECDCCQETEYLRRRDLEDVEKTMMARQKMAEDHKDCEQYRHNPQLARTYREYKRSLKNEMERAARRNKV